MGIIQLCSTYQQTHTTITMQKSILFLVFAALIAVSFAASLETVSDLPADCLKCVPDVKKAYEECTKDDKNILTCIMDIIKAAPECGHCICDIVKIPVVCEKVNFFV